MKRLIMLTVLIIVVFLITACLPKDEPSPEEKEIFSEEGIVGLAAAKKDCKQTTVLSCVEDGSSITALKVVKGRPKTYTFNDNCPTSTLGSRSQGPMVRDYSCASTTVLRYCILPCATGHECKKDKCVPLCGNGIVNTGETCSSCPADVTCGSGEVCQSGECVPLCGNGVVDSSENCNTCPADSPCSEGELCDPSGICVLPEICGNGIIEGNEVCDDGNTVSNDLCSATCSISNPSPIPTTPYCSFSPTLQVVDQQNQPLPDAKITIYWHGTTYDTYDYPYENYPDENILLVGTSDQNGQFTLPNTLLASTTPNVKPLYTLTASKPGYISSATISRNVCVQSQYLQPVKLISLEGYTTEIVPEVKERFFPVKIDRVHQPLFSTFEVVNRPIILSYHPQVAESLRQGLTRVDIKLTIVTHKFTQYVSPSVMQSMEEAGLIPIPYPLDDPAFYYQDNSLRYEFTQANVKLDQFNTFQFSIPQKGHYYPYFTFDLYYTDETTRRYNYYPEFHSATTTGYPPSIAGQLQAEGFDSTKYTDQDYLDFIVLDPPADVDITSFKEIIAGHNNPNENRINIIFINSEFEPETFAALVQQMITDSTLSFSTVEPFQSNLNKFNFWYFDQMFQFDDLNWNTPYFSEVLYGNKELSWSQKIYMANTFPGKSILVVLSNDETLSLAGDQIYTQAGSGKCQFKHGTLLAVHRDHFQQCLAEQGLATCFNNQDFQLGRVLLHELGHELWLGEEYVETTQSLFDINAYANLKLADYNPPLKPNTYFSSALNPSESCYNIIKYFETGYHPLRLKCFDEPHATCLNSPWHDFVGNGCGQEGIVDCSRQDSQSKLEIGCFYGGGLAAANKALPNLAKPSFASIMADRSEFAPDGIIVPEERAYGLANERSLCRAIRLYTGSVEGVCGQLCLEGCPSGQKCISGQCQ